MKGMEKRVEVGAASGELACVCTLHDITHCKRMIAWGLWVDMIYFCFLFAHNLRGNQRLTF